MATTKSITDNNFSQQKFATNPTFGASQLAPGATNYAATSVEQPGFFSSLGDFINSFFGRTKEVGSNIANKISNLGSNPSAPVAVTAPTVQTSPSVTITDSDLVGQQQAMQAQQAAQAAQAYAPTITDSDLVGYQQTYQAAQPINTQAIANSTASNARAATAFQQGSSPTNVIQAGQPQVQSTTPFGWSPQTWSNIDAAMKLGTFGWNLYYGWQGLQNAKDMLAEQSMMNAYNRSLSTFNTNTQIEQANQSLRDRLYARQKYETGSTEGAEALYKERELQKFRG